ncbi:hypothetical protein RF11_04597 [Thelohanellus kitauei]|uniref:Uncharacterized protein n=1 Tax=Thelohanellus kitauei TaxID=669202 RepID=A0A0C2MGL0_THEKT|nr:hypothetical protein RF11_04597 [Thelohanellus kitauei]
MEQKLQLYDDFKTTSLSIVTEDVINTVYFERQSMLITKYKSPKMQASENHEYKRYLHALSLVIFWFNSSTYLDQNLIDIIQKIFELNTFDPQNNLGQYNGMMIPPPLSDTSTQQNIMEKHLFYDLLEWFILIYEMKFIYLDIHSLVDTIDKTLPYLF